MGENGVGIEFQRVFEFTLRAGNVPVPIEIHEGERAVRAWERIIKGDGSPGCSGRSRISFVRRHQRVFAASVTVFNTTPGGGTSSAMTFTIVPFSIPSQPSAQTVAAGQAANFTIPTAPAGAGPAPTLSFSATGLPVGAAEAFMPSSVTEGTSSTMMVTTTSRIKSATTYEQFGPGRNDSPASLPAGVAFLALFLILAGSSFAGPLRKPLGRLAPVAALILVLVAPGYLAAFTSSSSSGNPNGTPAGSYTIKVTVSSAAGGLSTNVTLKVK